MESSESCPLSSSEPAPFALSCARVSDWLRRREAKSSFAEAVSASLAVNSSFARCRLAAALAEAFEALPSCSTWTRKSESASESARAASDRRWFSEARASTLDWSEAISRWALSPSPEERAEEDFTEASSACRATVAASALERPAFASSASCFASSAAAMAALSCLRISESSPAARDWSADAARSDATSLSKAPSRSFCAASACLDESSSARTRANSALKASPPDFDAFARARASERSLFFASSARLSFCAASAWAWTSAIAAFERSDCACRALVRAASESWAASSLARNSSASRRAETRSICS